MRKFKRTRGRRGERGYNQQARTWALKTQDSVGYGVRRDGGTVNSRIAVHKTYTGPLQSVPMLSC